jgi:aspartate/methionine/tyrosine aminotransferase
LPGEGFGCQLAGHLRLSYGANEEDLVEAARRLSAFVQKNG